MNKINYVTLFSSAGVGCYGFKKENFECVVTAELLRERLKIQKYNNICKHESGYILGDISQDNVKEEIYNAINDYKFKNNTKDIDIILATPPCQGISVANHKKRNELKRNSLIIESFKITKKIKPKFFIFENVQSFLKTECQDTNNEILKIKDALNKNLIPDYFIHSKIINLKNYGSNSSRTRTIVIGVRRDLQLNPIDFFPDFQKFKTVRQLTRGLKKLQKFGEISCDIYHSFRPYDKRMLNWIKDLDEGQSAFENKSIKNKPHQIINKKIIINTSKNGDKYKRNYWDKVAPCIHTRNDILASQNTIHPSENRVFSIRELMNFMTIPSDFKWTDLDLKQLNSLDIEDKKKFLKKNELNIRRCIGEAVPTKVLQNIAVKIARALKVDKIEIKNNYKSINKLIEIHDLTKIKNQKSFIKKYYKKLNLEYLLKVLELANPKRSENSAFFTDQSISIDISNFLPNFEKNKIRILEPSVGFGNILFQVIKGFSHLQEVEIDVFDLDKDILSIFRFLIKQQGYPRNIKINILNEDFLKKNICLKYDLIIGNPPFGKIKDLNKLKDYKKNKISEKNKNQFQLFMEKSLKLSKNIAFILPKSFISAPEYNSFRSVIEEMNIYSIIDFGEAGFKGVKIETIFLHLNGKLKQNNKTKFFSYIKNTYENKLQGYITDKKFPYWLLYRNSFFDKVASKLNFDTFDYFRDRQITKKDTSKSGKVKLLKSRNIDNNNIKNIAGYDSYLNDHKKFSVSKFLNKKGLYLVPNLSYYPRACELPQNAVPDGSAAILIPKGKKKIMKRDLSYFSSDEYTSFYRIARNFGTRSLNIDKNSVFFWGLKKAN